MYACLLNWHKIVDAQLFVSQTSYTVVVCKTRKEVYRSVAQWLTSEWPAAKLTLLYNYL